MKENMYRAQILREKFKNNNLVVGAHVFFNDPSITESFGYHGYEFVWIDAEHSAFDKEEILSHIRAAGSANTASIVRVAWNDSVLIKPVLEMGPDGVIFPMVSTKEEAEKAVISCLYPPKGIRGFGPRRANQYGKIMNDEYLNSSEESFLRIIQIEHVEAVKNLDDIIKVNGIDLVMVGPNDLAASAGHIGDLKNPEVINLYDEIAFKCKKGKMPFGVSIGPQDKEFIQEWINRGVNMIGCGDDISFISMGSEETMNYIKSLTN